MLQRRRPKAKPPTPSTALPGATHSSPGLRALLGHVEAGRRCRILDLGPALGANVTYLSRYSPRLRIADLIHTLQADPQLTDAFRTDPRGALQRIVPRELGPFDLVLAWDTFNYLDRTSIHAFATHLADLCVPGAPVFCLVSTEETVPHEPIAFKIADRETLVYDVSGSGARPCPRFSLPEFEAALHGFAVDKIFLLRHGVREYVLVRKSDSAAP